MRRFLRYWLPWLLWMLLIFFLSDQDKDETSTTSGWFLGLFRLLGFSEADLENPIFSHLIRKAAHLTIYFILFLWTYRVERLYWPHAKWPWRSLCWCLLYAISDEFHQYFVPGRGPHITDVMIDTSGAILAWLCWWIYEKKYISISVDQNI